MRTLLLLLFVASMACLAQGFRSLKGTTSTDFCARNRNVKRSTRSRPAARVKRQIEECIRSEPYRSGDGTCNNLNNPNWGAGGQTYQRLLDPVYDDGKDLPRLTETTTENYLPTPRDISVVVHDFDLERPHPRGTVMLIEWGQFLAHDIAATPVDSEAADCCYEKLITDPNTLHPDVLSGGPCFPIIISEGDRYFTSLEHRCMEFVRSRPEYDANGVRQQVNELSSYIDGQNVYGHDDEEMDALREFTGGRLRTKNDDDLPESDTNFCVLDDSKDYCLQAGDSRVNAYPGLGAVHTIFMRYHNYIAGKVAARHADWDDEHLFQTVRKIVIAVMQRISYTEYLPMIISPTVMSAYGLSKTYAYDSTCDATLYNVIATSAFRFGHSMVPNTLLINGVEVESVDLYDRPYHVLNNLDSLLAGLVSKVSERVDRWYSKGMTDHLFELQEQDGYDIASLNIQRGRDHGLPPYNDWREFCGLKRATDWANLTSSIRYQESYKNIDDIDLYSGALNERPVEGGSVGETYACLLAKQFANLRKCDRFWYENTDTTVGFASARQREQINKVKLSHVICLTTGITKTQQNVFQIVNQTINPVQSCSNLLLSTADLSQF